MTKFHFVFTKSEKQSKDKIGYVTAGVYNWYFDEVLIYLPSIADRHFEWLGVDFMWKMFKHSYVTDFEQKCIDQVIKTLGHEYIHVSLCKTECPLNKQHYGIEKI